MTEPRRDDWLDRRTVSPLPPRPGSFERIARTARRRRWARAAATGAAVVALLAGVSGVVGELREPGPDVGTLPGVSVRPTVAPSATPSPSASPPPSTAPDSTTTPTASPVAACTTTQVAVDVVTGDSSSGHIGLRVRFTNTSTQACTIRGYPRIVFVTGPAGTQVNDPATPVVSPHATVRLEPTTAAYADLLLVNVASFAPAMCQPQAVAGIRVTLPGEQATTYAATAQQMCARAGTGVAQIYPVSPG